MTNPPASARPCSTLDLGFVNPQLCFQIEMVRGRCLKSTYSACRRMESLTAGGTSHAPRRECPLLGVKRTSHLTGAMSAFDPKRTSAGWSTTCIRAPTPGHFQCRICVAGEPGKALNVHASSRNSIGRCRTRSIESRGSVMNFIRALAASIFSACILAGSALAQTYPDRPVTMLVAFPPGGVDDATAQIGRAHV